MYSAASSYHIYKYDLEMGVGWKFSGAHAPNVQINDVLKRYWMFIWGT